MPGYVRAAEPLARPVDGPSLPAAPPKRAPLRALRGAGDLRGGEGAPRGSWGVSSLPPRRPPGRSYGTRPAKLLRGNGPRGARTRDLLIANQEVALPRRCHSAQSTT